MPHILGSCERTTWRTPDWLFDVLDEEFSFDLDAAATDAVKKTDLYLGPDHANPLCRDALSRDWSQVPTDGGYRDVRSVWLNPPYGAGVGRWVNKAQLECYLGGVTVVVLINSQTDTLWFADAVQKADEVRFHTGRIAFVDPETGEPANRPTNRSMIVVFRPHWDGPPRYSVVDYRPSKR